MRIDNQTNRNSSNAYQKKNKLKKEMKIQEESYENNDSLDLSSGIVLLNHLLNKPEHRYQPIPFYFFNSAMKNAQQVSNIANSIQQQAMSRDVNLNYEMILDLVLSHENETKNNNPQLPQAHTNQTSAYRHISLRENEMLFFESFHQKSIIYEVSSDIISEIVVEYFQLKQAKKINTPTSAEQINLLKETINLSANSNILRNKTPLINILDSFSS